MIDEVVDACLPALHPLKSFSQSLLNPRGVKVVETNE
jgi:hypothetical protein